MRESIIPERLRNKKKERRQEGSGKQFSLLLFALLTLALTAFGAYYFLIPKQESFRLDFYTYSEVGTADFLEALTVKGTIVPKKIVVLETKIAGVIEEILVQEGQDVDLGDPLFTLYSSEIVAEKNDAETELNEAKIRLAQLGLDQELEMGNERMKILDAEKGLERARDNLGLQQVLYNYGSIPRIELEKAEQEVEAAERRLIQSKREMEFLGRKHSADQTALEKTVRINEDKLARAMEKMENFTVRAPFPGRVLSLKIPTNRIVTAHQELGELADLREQAVELLAAPGQTERFGPGSEVTITLGQTKYKGEVSYIAPQAKQGADGSTVLVRVDFLEEASHLRPNSAVTADVHLRLHKDSPFLPRGAYLTSGQQLFVYVIDGQTAKRREVQFGLIQGSAIQILRGLEPGEKVIVSSYDEFRHLEEIKIKPEGGHSL
ncbi:MAG: HlyD family efflux transporter periplasmic adaptor subunit [Firmicutes bacterium]|nr:HlyD family efflux transporter periplasmic adaptor subunit [Bacillota bacterium]